MNNQPIRVAHIMGKMVSGGVESVVMNYYRNINKGKVQFDFIVDEDSTYIPTNEIESMGGRVIIVPPYQKIHSYIKRLKEIFIKNEYKIVHSHLNTLSIFPLYAAKISNVPLRIAHSHSTSNKKEWKKNMLKNILKPFSKLNATHYFCCSELAGRWLFGDKAYNDGKVKLINNAINVDKFIYDENIRREIRKELKVEDKFVIGHIGRFVFSKNHDFLIEIFKEVNKINKNICLLLIGEGEIKDNIIKKVNDVGISDKIKFLGIRDDVNDLMQAMDVFVLPSRYEGLGMVTIESQAAGLKTIVSDKIPKEAKVTELLEYLRLEQGANEWANKILEYQDGYHREKNWKDIKESGYEIKEEAKKLEKFYKEAFNKYK